MMSSKPQGTQTREDWQRTKEELENFQESFKQFNIKEGKVPGDYPDSDEDEDEDMANA